MWVVLVLATLYIDPLVSRVVVWVVSSLVFVVFVVLLGYMKLGENIVGDSIYCCIVECWGVGIYSTNEGFGSSLC